MIKKKKFRKSILTMTALAFSASLGLFMTASVLVIFSGLLFGFIPPSIFVPRPKIEEPKIKIEVTEQATYCALEDRQECTTGLAFDVNSCEPSYAEACFNLSLAILNDPDIVLTGAHPYTGRKINLKPDAWIVYKQRDPQSSFTTVEPAENNEFISENNYYTSSSLFLVTSKDAKISTDYREMNMKVKRISNRLFQKQ